MQENISKTSRFLWIFHGIKRCSLIYKKIWIYFSRGLRNKFANKSHILGTCTSIFLAFRFSKKNALLSPHLSRRRLVEIVKRFIRLLKIFIKIHQHSYPLLALMRKKKEKHLFFSSTRGDVESRARHGRPMYGRLFLLATTCALEKMFRDPSCGHMHNVLYYMQCCIFFLSFNSDGNKMIIKNRKDREKREEKGENSAEA